MNLFTFPGEMPDKGHLRQSWEKSHVVARLLLEAKVLGPEYNDSRVNQSFALGVAILA